MRGVNNLTDIKFRISSPGAEINHVGSVPYFFRSGTIYVDGKQIKSPTRSATTVEFNANSKLKEILRISSEVSIVEKVLKRSELKSLLRGSNGYVNLNNSIDRHISKMKYSPLNGFIVRPQKNAKSILASRKEEYERLYDYSKMIAANTRSKFWGLTFPHSLPIEDVKDLWAKFVIEREDNGPYPIIFLDPSDEDFTAFQYTLPFLKSAVKSGHIHALGLHYNSPAKMQPIIRELVRAFNDLDVAMITTGIERESRYRSVSGLHGQELFMSDVVAMGSGRWFPPKQQGSKPDEWGRKENVVKAFDQTTLIVNHLKSILGDKGQAESLLTSIRKLNSSALSELMVDITQRYKVEEILQDNVLSESLSNAFKLHELERSGKEIGLSRKFAEQSEVRDYVRQVKPSLNEWLREIGYR